MNHIVKGKTEPMNKKKLVANLRKIGVRKGLDLLVHSSLKRTGPVQGGPEAIIDGLLEAIGPRGTLLMPTISGSVTPTQPVFHVEHTPSSVGYLTNVFRQRKGAVRSLHPVHSVAALGPKAEFYTQEHLAANTPWSPGSPYGKLMRNHAWILFLGVNLNVNSCFHALEIEALIPGIYTEKADTLFVIDYNGALHEKEHHWHSRRVQYFLDMEHILLEHGALTYGQIGTGISRLVDAAAMRKIILPLIKENPDIIVHRDLDGNRYVWQP